MTFIRLIKSNNSDFEKETGLPNATLANYLKRDADFTAKNLDKIANRYLKELTENGFYVVNIDPFGGEQLAILNEREFQNYRRLPDNTEEEKAQPEGQAKGIEERIKDIDTRTSGIEASLKTDRKNQEGLLSFVTELLYRDCLREAKGNEDKAHEILDEILHRISPELHLRLKESIRADGHS